MSSAPDVIIVNGGSMSAGEVAALSEAMKRVASRGSWIEKGLLGHATKCALCMKNMRVVREFAGLDDSYVSEYKISGMCRTCQDEMFD